MDHRAKPRPLVRGSLIGLAAWSLVSSLASPAHAAGHRSALDPTFGTRGRVITHFTQTTNAQAVAFGPRGTIVVAGGVDATGPRSFRNPTLVARYLPDGRLDRSFGGDGKVSVDMLPRGEDCCPRLSMAVQPDGKVLMAFDDVVMRLNADGSPDGTFGVGGQVQIRETSGGDEPLEGLALTGDGRILVGGDDGPNFGLSRLLPDGRPDLSFGRHGRVHTDFFGGCDYLASMAVDPGGFVVLAGMGQARPCNPGRGTFEMARYRPDGRLDPHFGAGGKLIEHRGNIGSASPLDVTMGPGDEITVLRGGRILRFHSDGTRDLSFGHRGAVALPQLTIKKPQLFDALAVDEQGRTMVVGATCFCGAGNPSSFEVFRFLPSGEVDPSFGVDGRARTSFDGTAVPWDVGIDPAGRPVVAGGTNWTLGNFAVARYRS